MTKPAVFSGSYSDLRFVRTRKVAAITVEIPIEDAARFIEAFGAPNPGAEIPVAIARLDPKAKQEPAPEPEEPKERRRFNELPAASQIAISCEDDTFREYLRTICRAGHLPDNATACDAFVKGHLGVESKKEVLPGTAAFARWTELYGQYSVWLRYERQSGAAA